MKFLITITLSFLLVLTFGTSSIAGHNDKPCMQTQNQNGYNNFLKRHILPAGVDTKSKDAWKAHITKIGRCKTKVQSFIPETDKGKVEDICNGHGKTLAGQKSHLCISDNNIPVYHVKVDTTTCEVTNDVQLVTEQLIVACDKVDNRCRPVHFEGKKDQKSDNNSNVCKP